ncbi:MAG: hypothetical protein U0793_13640 [Gemmataceae bacterium]
MKKILLPLLLAVSVNTLPAQEPKSRLLITFASYRDRAKHSNIFFYEHDGVATGKIIDNVSTPRNVATAEGHPWLTADARFCAYTFELENKTSRINFWDRTEKKLIELPVINDSPNAIFSPSMSADGNLIAFTALTRPKGAGAGYHVYLYDRTAKTMLDLPGLNSPVAEDRMAKISGDGRFIVFISNRKGGVGLTDIYLYDRKEAKLVDLPGLNSPNTDTEPALNHDGSLIAFASDRKGGMGGRDIYLYDRKAAKLIDLPGLNSEDQEHMPALSPDGRYLAFVSERFGGEGQRDIYLYDRKTAKLLATAGLNSKAEDFDPQVIQLKGE